jgi:glyoxylase-like metal-dependent hydrolase (beta-lactamase superfamily II)
MGDTSPIASATELVTGIWHWATRHPDWHPGQFGAEVGSYAVEAGDELLLVDPLLPADYPEPVLELIDRLAAERSVHALITIGYHVRSAEHLCERYGGRIWGPRNCASRLGNEALLTELTPDAPGPAGVSAFAIGSPVRSERPLWLPSQRALAFGDALVTTPDGELRAWVQDEVDEKRLRWYRDRFAPTLEPLLELPVEHVLVTHGDPVVEDGARALRDAVAAEPWYHRG